ncbi:BspA family leucine-rich repeat surface protein [Candidatus Halobeggiatoa sp. HSG11]|nr:BspA family leucine-rich repeat surface protein [Candidatus Halobeggiatoa sp. HSG11]
MNIRTLSILVLLFFVQGAMAAPADDFVTTWKTDNPGSSNSTSIIIPTTGGGYSYDVDWDNNGVFDEFGLTGNVTHNFGVAGTYTIRIQGTFPRIYFNSTGDKRKILDVVQWGNIVWESMERAFFGASNLQINATDSPDLSSVTSMSYMFREATAFNRDISGWNVDNVTNMRQMFSDASFFNQDISNWNVSNVTNMYRMFYQATAFNQDISGWNVSNVTDMSYMFVQASSFNQDISNWNVSNVTNMNGIFWKASVFNQDISNWNVSNVTDMSYMFYYATAFNQPLNDWGVKTSSVTNMYKMFSYASSFNQDISNWNVSNVTDMNGMFSGASAFNQDISSWNVSNVTDMIDMFNGSTLSTANYNALLEGWNALTLQSGIDFHGGNSKYTLGSAAETARNNMTSGVGDNWTITDGGTTPLDGTSFTTKWKTTAASETITIPIGSGTYLYDIDCDDDGTFEQTGITVAGSCFYASAGDHILRIQGTFPAIYINNGSEKDKIWDVMQWGNIAWGSMEKAFYGASNLQITATDSPDLSSVTSMSYMFREATAFNRDISGWNVSSVTDMSRMFREATAFNSDISSWNVSNVTNMEQMFSDASFFNQDISNWNVSNVTNMYRVFYNATAFNQDISGWNVSNVTNMSSMFERATAFNQPLNTWNVSNVTNMRRMFYNATAFNQDMSGWNVSNVTDMFYMFINAFSFNQDISNWNVSSVINMFGMFWSASSFNQDISSWNVSNVTDMSYMFYHATAFNQPLNGWGVKTSNVTNMSYMFMISSFNQDLSNWNVNNVTDMNSMFYNATAFNQDLSNWNVSNITDMSSMFRGATAFNQDISSWSVSNVTNMSSMFMGVTLSTANYNALLEGWNALTLQSGITFDGGNSQYTCSSAAETARTNMIGTDTWSITDGNCTTKLGQTITFTNPGDKSLTESFNLGATTDSGLTISYTSTTIPVCTVGTTTGDVTPVTIGTCTITASQAGDATYTAAADITQTFAINDITPPPPPLPPIPQSPTVFHNLTITKTGNGTIEADYGISCGTDCEYDYADQTELTLIATPNTGWILESWTGDCDNDGYVRINKDKNCIATFKQQYSLTINTKGQGTVDNCGTSCTQTHLDGETVNLTTDSELTTVWSGDCDQNGNVTLDSNKTCTATFTNGYPLNIHIENDKGKIKTATKECQTDCIEVIAANSTITLTAEPEHEWILGNWSGDCDSNGNVVMDSEKTCTALFIPDPYIPNDGDSNNDGIKDIDQSNVIAMRNSFSNEYLTIVVDEEVNIAEVYTDIPKDFDDSLLFPEGIFYIEIEGSETDVTIYYHGLEYIQNPAFHKFGATTPGDINTIGWYAMPNVTFGIAYIAGKDVVTAKYHLKDGELGDNTGVDGRIVDPGGITTNKNFDNVIGFITKEENISTKVGEAKIIVSRSGVKGEISVNYTTENDTAIAGQDYQTVSGTLIWEEADREDKIITVPILSKASTGKTFTVHLSNLQIDEPQIAVLGLNTTKVNIYSNIISFNTGNENLPIQTGNIDLTISRSGVHNNVSVDYTTIDDTAIANVDYQPISGTLTWLADDDVDKTLNLSLLDQATINKTLNVVLSNLIVTDPTLVEDNIVEDGILDIDAIAINIITDDETMIGFNSRGYTAKKKDGIAYITVNRSGDIQGEVTVDYTTIDSTALANQDYVSTNGTLTWANGEIGEKTFTINLLDDAQSGSLLISLDNITGANLGIDIASLLIQDDSLVLSDELTLPEVVTPQDSQEVDNNQDTLKNVHIPTDVTVNGGKLAGTITSDGYIKDATIEPDTYIHGGYLSGNINNQGILVGVDIAEGTVVTGGILVGPIRNEGTIKDAILRGSISGGYYDGNITNEGLLGNATVLETGIVTGGKITGFSVNNGIIGDITLSQYAEISGGNFAGDIINNGTIDNFSLLSDATLTGGILDGNIKSLGTIQDVELKEGVRILGGTLAGEITGDMEHIAQIGATELTAGTKLSYVRLSPTVIIPEDVKLGIGVVIPKDYDNPTPEDFGFDSDKIDELQADDIDILEPEIFATLEEEQIAEIPAETFAAIEEEQLNQFTEEAVAVISPEQFAEMPAEALAGLNENTIDDLSVPVLNKFTPQHIDNLNSAKFRNMPSRDISRLLVNLNTKNIATKDIDKLLPDDWKLDRDTGKITAPIGSKITPRYIPKSVNMPNIPDMNSSIGLGGSGTSLMDSTTESLAKEDLTDFVLSQEESGILNVDGIGDQEGKQYAFIPDAENVIQVDTDEIPIGLDVGAGGFYTITTPEGQQYKVIPAPKDPEALSKAINGRVKIGKRGDVLMQLSNKVRNARSFQVVMFDPFVEQAPESWCVFDDITGESMCDFDNASMDMQPGIHFPRNRAKLKLPQAKVVYDDGSSQSFTPTVYSPETFLTEGLKFPGVEKIAFNMNGTFYVLHEGREYIVMPSFNVQTDSKVSVTKIELNEQGGVSYSVPVETPQQTRRAREVNMMLMFDLFVEPAPDSWCVDNDGAIFCDFDNVPE